MSEDLSHENMDGVSLITLNRPEKLNALTEAMLGELLGTLRDAEEDDSIHAAIIRGAGRSFCAGHDLVELERRRISTGAEMAEAQRLMADCWMEIWQLQIPVIAAVQGHCLGGGLEIALHADFIVAASDAKFGYPPVRTGLPDSQMFAFRMGVQWAKWLLYTGGTVDADTARRIGMVLDVVHPEQLDAEVFALAEAIRSVPPPLVRSSKRVLNAIVERAGLGAVGAESRREFAAIIDSQSKSDEASAPSTL